jgi:hypothetical protein
MALSPLAKDKLDQFLALANASDPHEYDNERWHAFIIQAHRDGGDVLDSDVSEVVRQIGWADEHSVELGRDYYAGRMLLAEYDKSQRS